MSKMTYEAYLEQYGEMTYRNVGISMLPMLKEGRDLFTVKKKSSERCKKYDVVLYRRPQNQYVLHRIIKVRDNDYVILGDNCINIEYGITDDDIIGVMTSFIHKGKLCSVDDICYKLYVYFWCSIYPLRITIKKVKGKLKRWIKRM